MRPTPKLDRKRAWERAPGFLSGAQSLASFKTVIDRQLRRAEEQLKRGTPQHELYEALIANGSGPVTGRRRLDHQPAPP